MNHCCNCTEDIHPLLWNQSSELIDKLLYWMNSVSAAWGQYYNVDRDSLMYNFIPVVPMSGFQQSTPLNCKSGATVTCVRWVRFQSIEAWIPWTLKLSSTPNRCCPHPNTALEMKATWGPWAPSVRLVANIGAFIYSVSC